MRYNTYLFDFDGTLVDSMPSYIATMLRILDENRISYSEDIIKTITPLGYLGTANYYVRELGLALPVEEIMASMNKHAYEAYAYRIAAKSHVIETLQQLKAQGADLHVLTASPHTVLDVCLKRLGIFDLFTNVWSCDDFNTTKADPQIYVRAAEKMGTTVENVLFLDDNLNADQTAKAAGMQVCGVYDESSKDYVAQMKTANDYYIYDFQELLYLETDKKA